MNYILTFFIAFLVSVLLSPLTIKLSHTFNILSRPKKVGGQSKPCIGGVAIYLSISAISIMLYLNHFVHMKLLLGLMISSSLIFLLGLIDDAKDLRPRVKILVELIAIGILLKLGFFTKIAFLPMPVNIFITLIWVILITNAFNLLDIVDGLSSGLIIIISSTLLVIALICKDILSSIILLSIIGAHLGFIVYNYPPAKLYMGDTGSLFTGFMLAAVAINIDYSSFERPLALLTPILAMGLPIYDTLFLIIMRLNKQRSIFMKSKDHFALRLETMEYSVNRIIWIMYSFSFILSCAALVVAFTSTKISIITLFAIAVIFISVGKKVGMVRVND